VRHLVESGAEVRAPRVKHDEPALHAAALAHFGTFARALRAAGVAPSPRRKVTRATVVADLRALARAGVRMTASDVVDAGRNDVLSAAHRYFGGFIAARAAAGLAAPPARPREVRWGRAAVIATLRRAHAHGEPLSHSRADRDLFRGALSSFRTWRAAIEAAGIDYATVQLRQHHYTDDELLDVLRDLHRRHPAMTVSELQLCPPHGNLLRQRFGDARAVARSIGIKDWPRRAQPVPPSAAQTLRALRARARAGKSYGPKALAQDAPQVALGAVHHFGGVAAAVKAAGIPPVRNARRQALVDELLREIRQRAARRRSMRRVDALRDAPGMLRRAEFYFGTWARAVTLALARRSIRPADFGGQFARRQGEK
jgi:hypothetical protein